MIVAYRRWEAEIVRRYSASTDDESVSTSNRQRPTAVVNQVATQGQLGATAGHQGIERLKRSQTFSKEGYPA